LRDKSRVVSCLAPSPSGLLCNLEHRFAADAKVFHPFLDLQTALLALGIGHQGVGGFANEFLFALRRFMVSLGHVSLVERQREFEG